jgi:acetyltransferase-like isoleucine patch superfamily enzyme
MPHNIIRYGKVILGENAILGDNITLGHKDNGTLIIGNNSIIRSGSIIYSDVTIGNNFRTGHNVLIRENTRIGDNALVGTNTVVDGNCVIGNNLNAQTGVYITAYTVIEDDVFMGPCSVTTNDKYMQAGADLKGPIIKKGARIGANATILPGIIIGEEAVIGSGAVVVKDVGPKSVVAGNPAKVLRTTPRGNPLE